MNTTEKSRTQTQEQLDELSRLNNELINLQRKLRKKNAELEKANERISKLVRTDSLTKLANRRRFWERMEEVLSESNRHGTPVSLLICDLDHFKEINDELGHQQGDAVLRRFGRILKEKIRTEDVAARWGGEEFIILLPGTGQEGARQMAERIRQALEEAEILSGRTVTASFGVASRGEQEPRQPFVKRADEALYRAKQQGRNRTEVACSPGEGTDSENGQ